MQYCFMIDTECESYMGESYAWITSLEYFDMYGCLDDQMRGVDIEGFKGWNDMEAHFAFYKQTPEQTKEYLLSLGMVERSFE